MKLLRPLLFVAGIGLIVAVAILTFARKSDHPTSVTPGVATPVEGAMAAKAQEHCWYGVKSRSDIAKATAGGAVVSSTSASTERMGDLMLVTGAIEPAVGDNRYYGCALYEYTAGSPVVVLSKMSSSPPRADTLIPPGFGIDGKKQ